MSSVRIALDAMGGDFGPKPIIEGALRALGKVNGLHVILVGLKDQMEGILNTLQPAWRNLSLEIVSVEVVDEMGESKFELARKRRLNKETSFQKCLYLVKEGTADGALSAGSTTASVFWSLEILGAYPTPQDRPAIPIPWPNSKGFSILIDGGASVEADSKTLGHFATLGCLYAQYALGKPKPTVGLLSVGEERTKGSPRIREAYQILAERLKENFVGMVEGKDLPRGKVDVVVCDGFIGNIVLKLAEGLIEELGLILKSRLSLIGKLGAMLMLKDLKGVKRRLSWESYGAMPLLGVNGCLFVAHGKSTPTAIDNALQNVYQFIQKQALPQMKRTYPSETLKAIS